MPNTLQPNQRGKYFNQHKKFIKHSVKTNPLQLREGNIILVKYKSESRNSVKESLYLVVNKNFNGNIHTFDLDYFPPQDVAKLLRLTKDFGRRLEKFGNMNVTWLDFGATGKALYAKAKSTIKEGYRVLSMSPQKLYNCELVEYDFGIPEVIQTVQDPHKPEETERTTGV